MHPSVRSVLTLAILGGALATVLGWQHHTTAELRTAIARQRTEMAQLARLRQENRRLLASQPTEAELADLLAGQIALQELQAQRAAMHRREEQMAHALAAEKNPLTAALSLKGNSVDCKLWRNVGQATPYDAFQTALWAAASGDLDTLAGVLALDDQARAQAAVAFGRLPPAMQSELGTPEKLIALLTAMDVPLGRASILTQASTPDGIRVSSQLVDTEGKAKMAVFNLQADGDRWRLQVPAGVVRKYSSWLQAASGNGAPK